MNIGYRISKSRQKIKIKIKINSYFSIWGCSRKFGEISLFIVFCVIIYTEIGIMNTINIEKEVQSILKQGFLDKQSRFWKTWRSRWFVLTPQYLMTFKQRKVYNSPTQVMSLKSITSIKSSDEQTSKQFTFRIDTDQDTFYIAASSNSEREQWIGQIGKSMVKLNNVIE